MTRTVLVAPEWRARLAALGLADPAALLEAGDPACRFGGRWELLSKPGLGGRSRWRWTLPPDATPSCPRPAAPPGAARPAFAPVLYVKRYERASLREQLDRIRRQAARHSRAWWEYRQSHELGRRGIAAVRAVAMADEQCGSGWCEFRSVVVFEAAAGDAFDRIWPRLVAAGDPLTCAPRRHELTRQLARFVAAFHETGICHRDLYLCHVFLDVSGDSPAEAGWAEAGTSAGREQKPQVPASAQPTLIDLARTHRPRLRRTRWIIKDLSQLDTSARQLDATRADRLRFLTTYLRSRPGARPVRWYARRIVRKSDRILRRIARKAARLQSEPLARARGPNETGSNADDAPPRPPL